MVLSNRDKSQHSLERGLDSGDIQTEQFHDHAGNRRNFDLTSSGSSDNTSGLSSPMSSTSGSDSSQDRRTKKTT
jgi:hypothetical protein